MEKKKYAWHFNIQSLFKVLPFVISLLTPGLVNIGKILKSQSLEGKPVDRCFFLVDSDLHDINKSGKSSFGLGTFGLG